MDDEFTAMIRTQLQSGTDYNGPIMTEAEAIAIIDYDPVKELNPAFITRASEVLFRRYSGIRVDLSSQCAMSTVNIFVGPEEAEADLAIAYTRAGNKDRRIDPDHPDSGMIPKISPCDANIMLNSLDYISIMPSGGALALAKFDRQESPVELCFLGQVGVAQALSLMGADVSELVKVINKLWGIDYTAKIISDTAVVSANDLEGYIASGGRPPPMSYISPNYLSRYRKIVSPALAAERSYNIAIFWGRHIKLCQHVLAMTNIALGNRSAEFLIQVANPGAFPAFNPASLKGFTIKCDIECTEYTMSSYLDSKATFDAFMEGRSIRKALDVRAKAEIVDNLNRVFGDRRLNKRYSNTGGVREVLELNKPLVFDKEDYSEVMTCNTLVPMIFSPLHRPVNPATYYDTLDICLACFVLSFFGLSNHKYAALLTAMKKLSGFAQCITGMNLVLVTRRLGSEVAAGVTRDAIAGAAIYRYVEMANPTVVSARHGLENWIVEGVRPIAATTALTFSKLEHVRVYKHMFDILSRTPGYTQKPYSYVRRFNRAFQGKIAGDSFLSLSARDAASAITKAHDAVRGKAKAGSHANAFARQLRNIAVKGWVNHYANRAISLAVACKKVCQELNGVKHDPASVTQMGVCEKLGPGCSMADAYTVLVSSLVIESCRYAAIGEFMRCTKVLIPKGTALDFKAKSAEEMALAYRAICANANSADICSSLTPSVPINPLSTDDNSAFATACKSFYLNHLSDIPGCDKAACKEYFVASVQDAVVWYNIAIEDMVLADIKIASGVTVAPAAEVAEEKHEPAEIDMAAVMKLSFTHLVRKTVRKPSTFDGIISMMDDVVDATKEPIAERARDMCKGLVIDDHDLKPVELEMLTEWLGDMSFAVSCDPSDAMSICEESIEGLIEFISAREGNDAIM